MLRFGGLIMGTFNLIPREAKFFDLFEQMTKTMAMSAKELKSLVDNWSDVETKVALINEIEHEGDTTTHQIMYQLNRTFITPFDREDITLLAHSLDDVIDLIHAAADTMLLYKVKAPGLRARELADIIVQIVGVVEQAIPQLRHRSDIQQMLNYCVEINRLENVADKIYRSALTELFDNTTDIAEVIKWREIYQEMENATDRCEDVANVLEGVALKHA
jgi:predicted phosphate transport protein (TIGR00153 family)